MHAKKEGRKESLGIQVDESSEKQARNQNLPLEPGAELALIELIKVPPLSRELIPTELFKGVALDEDVSMLERLEREREPPSLGITRI